jgi:hypothetical protein
MIMADHPGLAVIANFGIDTGIYALMNTRWGWPVTEIVHFTGLCMLMGSVGMFDLAMMGLVRGVSLKALHRLVPFGVAGFALCVASGALFVIAAPYEYVYNNAWLLKMAFMAAAGVNMILFYRTCAPAVRALGPDDAVPRAARIMAIVSLACWLGVITCGRVITAFRPYWE